MRTSRLARVAAATALVAIAAPAAVAAQPDPVLLSSRTPSDPSLLVDRSGNVHAAWVEYVNGTSRLVYARRRVGTTAFVRVAVPMPVGFRGAGAVLVYQLPAPSREIRVVTSDAGALYGIIVARSPNGGAAWQRGAVVPGTQDLTPANTARMVTRAGALIGLVGIRTGGVGIVTVRRDLTGASVAPLSATATWPTEHDIASTGPLFGARPLTDGTVGWIAPPREGVARFLTCHPPLTDAAVGARTSGGVLLLSGCGRTVARTLSSRGALGPTLRIGTAYATPSVDATHDTDGSIVAAFSETGGDVQTARLRGSRWAAATRLVPVARNTAGRPILSRGKPTWLAWLISYRTASGATRQDIWAAPLTSARALPVVDRRGLARVRSGRAGLTAAAAPGAISLATMRRTGKVGIRVAVGYRDRITVAFRLERPAAHLFINSASATGNVRPGRTVTLTPKLLPGSWPGQLRKGDRITYEITGRNGMISFFGAIT